MTIGTLLLVVCQFFGSCQQKAESLLDVTVPDTVLPADKMLPLLVELHKAEARIANARLNVDTARALYEIAASDIMIERGLDTTLYKKSLRYYSQHPDVFKQMYSQVLDSLKTAEAATKGEQKAKKEE